MIPRAVLVTSQLFVLVSLIHECVSRLVVSSMVVVDSDSGGIQVVVTV